MVTKGKKNTSRNSGKQTSPSTIRWLLGSIFNLIKRFGNTLLWVCLLAYCAHLTSVVLIAYGGQTTKANLALRIVANLNVAFGISFTTTGMSLYLLFRERKLHRETRERLAARNTTLELEINKTRTSSKLTPDGLTRKEDL
jgi:hypothetical protein